MKNIILQVVGYLFLVLGVIGLVLPFLQGFLFIAIGLLILAKTAPWAERLLQTIRERYPRAGGMIDQADEAVDSWGRRLMGLFRSGVG